MNFFFSFGRYIMRMGNEMNEWNGCDETKKKTFINTFDYYYKMMSMQRRNETYFSCGYKDPWLKRFEKRNFFFYKFNIFVGVDKCLFA